jgi:hypothetical protein
MWHKVSDRLPDKTTRYASTYGVPVLVYDEQEAIDSGYYVPSEMSFSYETQTFKTTASGVDGKSEWVDAFWVTHWMELPLTPDNSIGSQEAHKTTLILPEVEQIISEVIGNIDSLHDTAVAAGINECYRYITKHIQQP